MSSRTLIGRVLSPGGFLLALVLFVLPFLTISCTAEDSTAGFNGSLSASPTGVDLVLDRDPSITIEQDGTTVTIDPSDIPGAGEEGAEAADDSTPWTIRGPMIGAAGVIVVGALLALIPAVAIRRWLSATAALAGAAALSYVVYVAAPNEIDESQSAPGEPSAAELGISFGVDPAIGFWVIVGVLAAVALLQFVPARGTPATAAAPPAPPPGEGWATSGAGGSPAGPGGPPGGL